MSVNLCPVFNDQNFTLAGAPAAGYKLFTYAAGSTTKTNTYTTSAGSVANANPIILDSNGYASNGSAQVQIWLTAGTSYKLVLAPPTDTDPPGSPIRTEDNIIGINDTAISPITEWIGSTFAGITYVSGTQFTVTGDQTALLTANRRLKTTNTSGTIYSYISLVDYNISNAGKTTVTTVNDSGTLDSGLSAVSYGIINPTNSSLFPTKVTQSLIFTGSNTFSTGTQTINNAIINETAEYDVAAAATTSNIGGAPSDTVRITGTGVTITAFPTVIEGTRRRFRVASAGNTIVHDSTKLILPRGRNIVISANDTFQFRSLGSGNWLCEYYKPQGVVSSVQLSVGVASPNGYGSTNTNIRRFVNTLLNVGTDITYADSVTLGGSFTINNDGVYAVQYSDYNTAAAGVVGISKNATSGGGSECAGSIVSVADAKIMGVVNSTINGVGLVSATFVCVAGDVIRAHTDGTPTASTVSVRFLITRVS